MPPTTSPPSDGALPAISAHAGDFVRRADGAIALAAERGQRAKVLCLSFGERGESARAWREGLRLDEIKELPRTEAANAAARMALQARVLAQAVGYDAPGEPLGAPPVFFFEPHQPEQCDVKPSVLLDITTVFDKKHKAMECPAAQQHTWDYCTDLAKRRGVQLKRNAGPDLGLSHGTTGEAYVRLHPETTGVPA